MSEMNEQFVPACGVQFHFIVVHIKKKNWYTTPDTISNENNLLIYTRRRILLLLLLVDRFAFISIQFVAREKINFIIAIKWQVIWSSHKVENVLSRWLVDCIVYLSVNWIHIINISYSYLFIVIHIQRYLKKKKKQNQKNKRRRRKFRFWHNLNCVAFILCLNFISFIHFHWAIQMANSKNCKIISAPVRPSFRSTCSVILWKIWCFRWWPKIIN